MTDPNRRLFLKVSVAGSGLAIAAGAGLLTPTRVMASWPKVTFNAKSIDATLKIFFHSSLDIRPG